MFFQGLWMPLGIILTRSGDKTIALAQSVCPECQSCIKMRICSVLASWNTVFFLLPVAQFPCVSPEVLFKEDMHIYMISVYAFTFQGSTAEILLMVSLTVKKEFVKIKLILYLFNLSSWEWKGITSFNIAGLLLLRPFEGDALDRFCALDCL